jgi:Zn-dependent protease with chaperone function
MALFSISFFYTVTNDENGMVQMDIFKFVRFDSNRTQHWCRYYGRWNNIPVYITDDDPDSRSALYKDGTCFIILGGALLKRGSETMIANRLWHEAAHLYFRDVWQPWSVQQEFRADLIASAATGRDATLRRLYDMKRLAAGTPAEKVIDKRVENVRSAENTYTKDFCLQVLDSLRPVNVMK